MSRRIIPIVCLIAVLVVGLRLWSVYRQEFSGSGPAFNPPAADIVELIDKREVPLTLPKGFSLGVFAKDLGDARVLVADPQGTLVVSVPSRGKILALPDANGDGKADRAVELLKGLNRPHGLAFRCVTGSCRLYVAETNALSVYDYDPVKLTALNRKKLADLPAGGEHVTRSLLFLPSPQDDQLLVAIGSTCNACHETDPRRAAISVFNLKDNTLKPYAIGLRNSVFQTIDPVTRQVWATEMGRDYLGDNVPPDEIDIIEQGKNYGWPNCYGQNEHDTQFDKNTYIRNPCMEPFETPSRIDIPAHSAPLGLAFGDGFLYVAYHGSWNRSVPTGYKVVRYPVGSNGDVAGGPEDFITGWLQKDGTLGRPVGLLFHGSDLLISDDKSGVVYRAYRTK